MRRISVAILVAFATTPFSATADTKAGEKKAQLCLLCHKTPNHWGGGVPLLEGRAAKDLVAAINEFKTGKRSSPAMQPNVASLSAKDIGDIADYFASRPAPVQLPNDAAE